MLDCASYRCGAGVAGTGVPRISESFVPITSPETTNSTRRFCCRPAAVSFVATGTVSPNPFAVRMSPLNPCVIRNSRTDPARCSDSFWLYSSLPTDRCDPRLQSEARDVRGQSPRHGLASLEQSAGVYILAVSKSTSDMLTTSPRGVSVFPGSC